RVRRRQPRAAPRVLTGLTEAGSPPERGAEHHRFPYDAAMVTWIAGTEESTVVSTGGGLPGRGQASTQPREPAGTWHAVNAETQRAACGTNRFMELWPDRSWDEGSPADRCPDCVAALAS